MPTFHEGVSTLGNDMVSSRERRHTYIKSEGCLLAFSQQLGRASRRSVNKHAKCQHYEQQRQPSKVDRSKVIEAEPTPPKLIVADPEGFLMNGPERPIDFGKEQVYQAIGRRLLTRQHAKQVPDLGERARLVPKGLQRVPAARYA